MTDRETTKLGEVLRTAREARFIDLARVERDTRIRMRYLSALELGDYRDLPPPVYTKGFLRNYGLYLGLDPEYLVDLYRLESGTLIDRQAVPIPRRPVAARQGRSLVITSNVVAAAILTVMVVALVVYLVNQLMTFGRIPELRITDPVSDVTGYSGTDYTIRGQTEPNSTVTSRGLRENPTATADGAGAFTLRVALLPGANVIILTATDPLTDRASAEVRRTITVVVQASPTPSSAPSLVP